LLIWVAPLPLPFDDGYCFDLLCVSDDDCWLDDVEDDDDDGTGSRFRLLVAGVADADIQMKERQISERLSKLTNNRLCR
jgi:hypothetical protein